MAEAGGEEAGGLGRGLVRLIPRMKMAIDLRPALILALALLLLSVSIFQGEFPRGADTWGHMAKAEYLAGEMRTEGPSAYFTAAWMPKWYMGDPFRTYYPPLTVLVLTPFVYLLRGSILAYRVFVTLLLVMYAILCYIFLYHLWGKWPATLGSVMALWAPYQLRTVFFEGNLPRGLALLALPVLAIGTEGLLKATSHRARWVGILALAWGWALLAHPQQAYIFAIGFALYIVTRLFLDVALPVWPAGLWVVGLLIGVALAAPWLFPAYVGDELPGIPYLPPEKVPLFSAPLSGFLPTFDLQNGRIAFGFGGIFLAVLAAVARPNPSRNAWLAAGFGGLWLSLGPSGVLFGLLPLSGQLLPERFLNFTAFAFPVAAAGLLPMREKAKAARMLIVVGMVVLDAAPAWPLALGGSFPSALAQVQAQIEERGIEGGRLALMSYPEPNGLEVYFTGQAASLINGWALENTPHHQALRRYLDAASWGPDYLQHLFGMWDVRMALLRDGAAAEQVAEEAVERMGFTPVEGGVSRYRLWVDPRQAAPVQEIPEARMLVVGDRLAPMLRTFPFAEEAERNRLSQLPTDLLETYPAVALYRFESTDYDLAQEEARIRSYVEGGGTLVVDLSGMEEAFGRALDFLGVDVLRLSAMGDVRVEWAPGFEELPPVMDLSRRAPEGWSGATYNGLDDVIARVEINNRWYPFIGYRDIGQGRAWFVGFNLLYYSQLSGEQQVPKAISELVLNRSGVSRDVAYQPVPVRDWQTAYDGFKFTSLSPKPVPEALVSYTYSPRWQISIDGEEVPFSSYQHMLKIEIPSGEHEVSARYDPFGTLWPSLGLGIGVSGLLLGMAVFPLERWWDARIASRGGSEYKDREYAPCANCGFVLAEVGPPTAKTYPFKAVHCPICGMRMDDSGFEPGETLSEEERRRSLAKWLEGFGYDLGELEASGAMSYREYFTEAERVAGQDTLRGAGERRDEQ
jgi:hypothetical protein